MKTWVAQKHPILGVFVSTAIENLLLFIALVTAFGSFSHAVLYTLIFLNTYKKYFLPSFECGGGCLIGMVAFFDGEQAVSVMQHNENSDD